MKSLLIKFFFIFITIYAYSPEILDAATMHALVIADTNNLPKKGDDPDRFIGKAVAKDIKHISQFLKEAAYASDLTFKLKIIKGDDVHANTIFNALDTINVNDDDVFVFYFSGHGFRFSNTNNPLPFIWLSEDNVGMSLNEIIDLIREKNARLSLVLADCCNNVDNSPCKILGREDFFFGKNKNIAKNFKKLFLNYHGILIATGSEHGGYGNTYDETGSDFTNVLIQNVRSAVKSKNQANVSWNVILKKVKKEVQNLYDEDDEDDDEPQIPYYDLKGLFEKE